MTGFKNGSPKRLSQGVSHLAGGLEHFAESSTIPQNQSIFHPILIAAILLTYLLSLVLWLFEHCQPSRIDDVSKYDDSMISLHKIYEIPKSGQCK